MMAWISSTPWHQRIDEIEPAANPGVNRLKQGKQSDHIRGVTRMAVVVADEMCALQPDLKVDKDLLIAGALVQFWKRRRATVALTGAGADCGRRILRPDSPPLTR